MAKKYSGVSAVGELSTAKQAELVYTVPTGRIAKLTFVSAVSYQYVHLVIKPSGSSETFITAGISQLGLAASGTSATSVANTLNLGIYFNEGDQVGMIYVNGTEGAAINAIDFQLCFIEEYDE